jgi:hypothetical protein
MPFQKGYKGGPGRPKNSQNILGRTSRENIAEVFTRLGGIDRMVGWAEDNLTEYYRIYSKLIPIDVQNNGSALVVNVVRYDEENEE